MKLNNRMKMAEAIKDAFLTGTLVQTNALKVVVGHINESALIDCLLGQLCRISVTEPTLISTLMSKIINSIASELIYSLYTSDLNTEDRMAFDAMIEKCNIFTNSRIKNRNHETRNNLVLIIMNIDQNIIRSTYSYRNKFSTKKKKENIDCTQKIVTTIRPILHAIIDFYNERATIFNYLEVNVGQKRSAVALIGLKPMSNSDNYMLKEPSSITDVKCKLNKKRHSLMTQSIDTILNMPFTFDEQYNTMIEAILDEPIFTELLAGKSSDVEAVTAKVTQAYADVKEGLEYWNELGKGNVYFKYVIDFRGRISQLGGLSAVGNKVGKSMVRSGHAHELGEHGYDEILIALAGAVGYDKETFATRLAWAKENYGRYEEIGRILIKDPVRGFECLRGTDDPFSCAVISLELVRISEHEGDVQTYCSNIFIGYDATSSAVQLVGLLMGNEKLTEASNVRVGANTEDKIHDSYMLLADIMDVAAPKLRDEDNKESIDMWMAFDQKIKRAFAKPLLMTRLYGSKYLTHMDSVREVAVDKGIIDSKDTAKLRAFGKDIATLFNKAFDNEEGFNCLRSYEKFVKEISATYNLQKKDTVWSVQDTSTFEPQIVETEYRKFEGQRYSVYFDGKVRVMRTYNLDIIGDCKKELNCIENEILDATKSKSAIAPNYIHSHDALVLHSTVVKLNKPMRLTHDCFATTPGMVHEMQVKINEVYVELFGDNKLKQIEALQAECFENTGVLVELPDNYNSNGIKSSEIAAAKYKFS